MISVINDPEADPVRKDRLAIAAAPFVHGRPVSPPPISTRNAAATEITPDITDTTDDINWAGDLTPGPLGGKPH